MRIFKYLKGTIDFRLLCKAKYHSNDLELHTDADYAKDTKTKRSRTGIISTFSWRWHFMDEIEAKKYCTGRVCCCKWKCERIDLAKGFAKWYYKYWSSFFLINNVSPVKLAENPEYQKRSNHVDVQYYFVREKFTEVEILIKHVPTETVSRYHYKTSD